MGFRGVGQVSVIGMVPASDDGPSLLLLTYAEYGSLLDFLRNQKPLSTDFKLSAARDVAQGMKHIASKRFIHRDLAARNCLVNSHRRILVADFGLSRSGTGLLGTKRASENGDNDTYCPSRDPFA